MDFGITFKSDIPMPRAIKLAQAAEAGGFSYIWAFDSHVLWQEVYTQLTVLGMNTQKMKLGPCVTNPRVRDITVTASTFATLQRVTGGRMQLGIGRGDSSRRVMGKKPTTVEILEHSIQEFRDLTAGKQITFEEQPIQLTWADGGVPPVWVAGYGPKALGMAGRVADGIILQFADPHLIKWCMDMVKAGADQAGRDFSKIKIMSAAPIWISDDMKVARDHVRWFPALVSNHVVDLINKYDPAQLPQELTAYVHDRTGYNYLHHAEVGSSNAEFVTDEIVDRYDIVGPISEQIRKLEELRDLGVHQFNIYLMCGDEEKQVQAYSKYVIPYFNKKSTRVVKPKAKPAAKKKVSAKRGRK
jgi:probable F420-dependent oxidoreductase